MNLALGRPASQSSTYGAYVASKSVDGDAVDQESCSITNTADLKPWWKVQLAYASWITHVELTNRNDSGKYGQLHVDMSWNIHTLKPETNLRYKPVFCLWRFQMPSLERKSMYFYSFSQKFVPKYPLTNKPVYIGLCDGLALKLQVIAWNNDEWSVYALQGICSLGPVSLTAFARNSNSMETSSCCNYVAGHQIATNVCPCRDSTAVVPCTNFVAITLLDSRLECNEISIDFEIRWKRR